MNRSYVSAILVGGTVAGALDLLFAISFAAYNGVAPVRLLQTIASGLLGSAAYEGGGPTAVLGFVLHFGLSLLWASIFLGLASFAPLLTRHPFAAGAGFGIVVFVAMRLVVLPLSAFPHPVTFKPLAASLDLLSHALLFGIPIALAAQRVLVGPHPRSSREEATLRVLILCGLPGVGKLTIANELARAHGYRVFHNHLVFDAVEALFPFESPTFVELRERLWVELLCRAVREQVGDVIFTIARDGGIDATFLVRLRQALLQLGAEVRCVELCCAEEELDHRVAAVERSRFGKIHSADAFRRLRSAGAFPLFTMPAGTVAIDTTGLSVPQAAALLAARLNQTSSGA